MCVVFAKQEDVASPQVRAPDASIAEEKRVVAPEDNMWVHKKDEVWHMKDGSEDVKNTYSRVDASEVNVRGKDYLKSKRKIPSKKSAYSFICSKCFITKEKMIHAAEALQSLKKYLAKNQDHEYLVINWLVPGHYTVVNLYVRTLKRGNDLAFDKVYEQFRKGDSKFRNSRFKLIPQVLDAPIRIKMLINSMLGGLRPVLIGQRLKCNHYTGMNYMEIDIDTGSSSVVSFLAGSMVKAFQGIIANLAFLIEGRDESELPERLLGIHCYCKISIEDIAIKCEDAPTDARKQWGFWSSSRKKNCDVKIKTARSDSFQLKE
mmetsp:Transcript_9567/g.13374  ORF Transcript_9567/g.13374 Transcript_9567/m.13374 type:complete len:318 (+) Transcript_9567:180-1133(+)|eukprot:CAMPEP_0184497296 /NCGR_PEP_ID=MMETSP0113_2-20130426/36135_1 /TAXON_ID=91329 /ORGANISM="Norrisiella sphaerica, Strain BC52" /LENGTH=317 /DNA_ID=CAMNT_0026884329 /DNA_START=144 /DNA_END=1097 /DNA_ORIENTATION=-